MRAQEGESRANPERATQSDHLIQITGKSYRIGRRNRQARPAKTAKTNRDKELPTVTVNI